jgi:DNA polymerase phi
VRAILDCGKDEKQYSDKLTGILRSKLTKVKEIPSGVTTVRAKETLRTLHELGRKVPSADHLSTISACSLYLSRILVHQGAAASAAEVYNDSLRDFATRKGSQINPSFLKEACRRFPEVAWCITEEFISAIDSAINGYRKCHIFDFIATFVTQPYTVNLFLTPTLISLTWRG